MDNIIYSHDSSAGAGGGTSSTGLESPAAGKKAKCAVSGFVQSPPPKCQVEGCDLDLKGAKSYYCRHKVCGMHSKSPRVIVAGLEQRFCQQCSRFHLLKEFDQGKRSCRRRLAGHNERRRKPPPPELLPSRYDRLSSFPDDNGGLHRGYLMDFMHPKPSEPERASTLWPSLRSGNLFAASELALSECIVGVSDSTRALSLLSNQPWGASSAFMSPMNTDQQPPVIGTSIDIESTPPNIVSCYLNSLPGFDDHELGSSVSHEAGLRQVDDTGNTNDQFSSSDVEPIEVYDHLHDLQWLL